MGRRGILLLMISLLAILAGCGEESAMKRGESAEGVWRVESAIEDECTGPWRYPATSTFFEFGESRLIRVDSLGMITREGQVSDYFSQRWSEPALVYGYHNAPPEFLLFPNGPPSIIETQWLVTTGASESRRLHSMNLKFELIGEGAQVAIDEYEMRGPGFIYRNKGTLILKRWLSD